MVLLERVEKHDNNDLEKTNEALAPATKNKIEAKNIHFGYQNVRILNDISINVQEGEFLVLMGPSGCGKSTFLRLLAGLEQPNAGDITIDDVSLQTQAPDCGVVFQDYSLFPWLTARSNIVLALKQKLGKTKKKQALQQLAEDYLKLVNLGHVITKYPGQMSGGMKQRAAIARALAYGSDLLLMDEPFGALDPITRIQLQDLMLQISREQKRTIVFVTHDADEAIYLADRIIMFGLGKEGAVTTSLEVPFKRKTTNRKKLFESEEFLTFRDNVYEVMNKEILNRIEETSLVTADGAGI
ncbi:ABC transporter ATP-binding protein [Lysinibacillus sp. NPDC056232]|uniref:ABC transporter ATP-binding protein n=1 Tax=Lysinibacillus sp. NPDC056232 TaxID=3345756 RepID=UPI0035D83A71